MSQLIISARIIFVFYLLIITTNLLAQEQTMVDSLEHLLQKANIDTLQINILNKLSKEYSRKNSQKAINYAKQALKLAEKKGYLKGKALAYKQIGEAYYHSDKDTTSIQFFKKSIEIYEEINDSSSISIVYMKIGNIYQHKNDFLRSLEYLNKSLSYKKSVPAYILISIIHLNIGNKQKALEYLNKAKRLNEKQGSTDSYATIFHLSAHVYKHQGNLSNALENYQKSQKYANTEGSKSMVATNCKHIGDIYSMQGNYYNAIEYFNKSLHLSREIGDKDLVSVVYSGLANTYFKTGEIQKTLDYAKKAYKIAMELNLPGLVKRSSEILAKAYAATGNYKKAYEYHVLFKITNDDLQDDSLTIKIINRENQIIYEQEKKTMEREYHNKELLQAAKMSQQMIIKNSFIGAFIMMILLALFIWRAYRIKKTANKLLDKKNDILKKQKNELHQQNEEITTQRDLLSTQNKAISESILYAKRIQTAVLPRQAYIDEIIPENFILFQPRDKVSGDFYWVRQINQYKVIAVADCTGHGIPGAIMSMLGISFMNDIVKKREITQANQALNELRKLIKEALKQTGKKGETDDGMDIALCALDTKTNMLQYSGANNPLYLIRNSEFAEIKADRMPIGYYPNEKPSFTNHEIQLNDGDIFYLFSDGFSDQFGGKKGFKYKAQNFQKILQENHNKPMIIQKELLEQELKTWMKGYEQTDDILVMGVRV